ncbi:hypothetical protein M1105_20480 [Limibaculum sp. FT325]|uniref:hypothetical protein n=1 Tax=Thermohalobaculum sediminis TaxID=2939436 RepID=UPI0020BFD055|nr:hypothetical protein [Limibaculum sediminis]MCL5779327.1 hypothetical protein [Limibaculum sediminis]
MGRKIEKFIKDVETKASKCHETSKRLEGVCKAWEIYQSQWDKYEPEMVKLANWEDHPYAKKRIAVWERGKNLAAQLRKEAYTMNDAVSDFNLYIAKREKSKNPFRSKKSLPAAREMIVNYSDVAENYVKLAIQGGHIFH